MHRLMRLLTPRQKIKYPCEWGARLLFFSAAVLCVALLIAVAGFVFHRGLPFLIKTNFFSFLLGSQWQPNAGIFGIFPMIIGTILTTAGALIIAAPAGILTAVYLSFLAPRKIKAHLKSGIEILAGIPSVIFGFFGLLVIVPIIDKYLAGGTGGNSLLSATLILAIMVLPVIISVSFEALGAVPLTYRDASSALGADDITTIFKIMLPCAKSGIRSGIVMGIGRAAGEAMAVILVSGNAVQIPDSLFSAIRTLAANCALEMSYASGQHNEALYASGVILFILIMIINAVLPAKGGRK